MRPAREPASSRPKPCASLQKPHESCPFAAPCGPRRKKQDQCSFRYCCPAAAASAALHRLVFMYGYDCVITREFES